MINIYYQDDFYGKEIATSLSRYVRFCLDEKDVKPIELSMNSEKFLSKPDDEHIIVFTNLSNNTEYWGTVIGKISKKLQREEWKLHIIDLTWQKGFPIMTVPEGIIISISKNCQEWLQQLTLRGDAVEINIKPTDEYVKKYYDSIDHLYKPHEKTSIKNSSIKWNKKNKELRILIIEDLENHKNPYQEYIEPIRNYTEEIKNKIDIVIYEITKKEHFDNLKIDITYDIAILDYDLRHFKTLENGWMYMDDILRINNHCEIILVTTDKRIDKDIKSLDPHQRDLISGKSNVVYISKTLEPDDFNNRIYTHVKNKIENLIKRRELQMILCECASEAYKKFMSAQVKDLIKEVPAKDEGLTDIREKEISTKEDTLELDKITERVIENNFILSKKPKIHEYEVLICTEEGGVANSLIYRLERPKFYIFSDPFDGSSAMKEWVREWVKTSENLPPELLNITIPSSLSQICSIDKEAQSISFKKIPMSDEEKSILKTANSSKDWEQVTDRLQEKIKEKKGKKFEDLIHNPKEYRKVGRKIWTDKIKCSHDFYCFSRAASSCW